MILLSTIALWLFSCNLVDANLLIETTDGYVKGTRMTTKKGRDVDAFLAIPFAEPPIGQLRFKEPIPIEPWKGVKDASHQHGLCPQRNIYTRSSVIEGDEDCLYLNVYRPKDRPSNSLLPIMIFFHGGGWLACAGNTDYYGPDVLLDQDIILVIPNYRLGALGFLSTGDLEVPGNNGLKDQVLAMKWVQKNAERFGGDPKSVTIFGESAGGASVHLHMLSPLTKGLFHKAISQSGTALCLWAFAHEDHGPKQANKLAELLNCPLEDSKTMIDCLRDVPADEIVALDEEFMIWDKDPMIPFRPVKEPKHPKAFMSEYPMDVIKSERVHTVPWINGINSEDGALRVSALYGIPHLIKELDEDFNNKVAISLQFEHLSENPQEIAEKIKKFYFNNKPLDNSTKSLVIDLYTDGWFHHGVDLATFMHMKYTKTPIYYYLFGHRGVASFSEIFGDKVNDYGVSHADELQYLFPVGDLLFPDKIKDEADLKVTDLMTTLWTNFAKYGHPTPPRIKSDLYPGEWLEVQNENRMNYLFIGGPKHEDLQNLDGLWMERSKFWRELPIRPENFKKGKQIVKDEL